MQETSRGTVATTRRLYGAHEIASKECRDGSRARERHAKSAQARGNHVVAILEELLERDKECVGSADEGARGTEECAGALDAT